MNRERAHRDTGDALRGLTLPGDGTGDGKFSFQYTVAAALLDRRIGIETFTDEAVHRPDIRALMDKTTVNMRPEIPANFEEMWIAVRVETTDGQTFVSRCNRPRVI